MLGEHLQSQLKEEIMNFMGSYHLCEKNKTQQMLKNNKNKRLIC